MAVYQLRFVRSPFMDLSSGILFLPQTVCPTLSFQTTIIRKLFIPYYFYELLPVCASFAVLVALYVRFRVDVMHYVIIASSS